MFLKHNAWVQIKFANIKVRCIHTYIVDKNQNAPTFDTGGITMQYILVLTNFFQAVSLKELPNLKNTYTTYLICILLTQVKPCSVSYQEMVKFHKIGRQRQNDNTNCC